MMKEQFQKNDLKNFGVNFHTFYGERSLHASNKVLESLTTLKEAGKIKNEDN